MPTDSIDTFFACSLMTILVLSAMAGLSITLFPHSTTSYNEETEERFLQLTKYILLNTGSPENWGENSSIVPSYFGLAETNGIYALNIDKVSRLNIENVYALSYSNILDSLKIKNVAIRMSIKPVFDVQINMTSNLDEGNETVYVFEIRTVKSGLPLSTLVKSHLLVEEQVYSKPYLTMQNGYGVINFSVSNSLSGKATLIVLAKHAFDPYIVSFATYPFQHNSQESLVEDGVFLQLSPLNYTLHVSLLHAAVNVSKAYAFSFNYTFELRKTYENESFLKYTIPRLQDISPLVLAVTGRNSTNAFVECVPYPQIPLETGATFSDSTRSNVITYQQIIMINRVLYEFTLKSGGPTT